MINIILWTLLGIPTGYVVSIFINDIHNISNTNKYTIITTIIFLSLLRGYTGTDLVTNIKNIIYN